MSKEFKTPPPFVRCDECNGGIVVKPATMYPYKEQENCKKCTGSPLPGWLPQWYTPEQWVEYVRRENNLPEYELPGDMPVWDIIFDSYGTFIQWELSELKWIWNDNVIIATDAGRPPEDWRPE